MGGRCVCRCACRRGMCRQYITRAPLAPPTITNVQYSVLDALLGRAVMIDVVEDLVLEVRQVTFTPNLIPQSRTSLSIYNQSQPLNPLSLPFSSHPSPTTSHPSPTTSRPSPTTSLPSPPNPDPSPSPKPHNNHYASKAHMLCLQSPPTSHVALVGRCVTPEPLLTSKRLR